MVGFFVITVDPMVGVDPDPPLPILCNIEDDLIADTVGIIEFRMKDRKIGSVI